MIDSIMKMNGNNKDIIVRKIKVLWKSINCIYLESVCSDEKITNQVLRRLSLIKNPFGLYKKIFNIIPSGKIVEFSDVDTLFYLMSSGFICIIVGDKGIAIEVKSMLDRSIAEPTTEKIIRGPKDCFTENINNNMGLIRKRIKDPNLWFFEYKFGRRTKTKVNLGYIKDICRSDVLNRVKKRLEGIDVDGIIDSGYIRDFLVSKSIFPTIQSTERPDLVSQALLDGKIVILVENSPFVLIIPGLLADYFKSSEDSFGIPLNSTFSRILRIVSFIVTITLPGLYVAIIAYNHEVLPNDLMLSIIKQRIGVPFSTTIELIILTLFFEMLRESDIRTPDAMGNSMSIVGALILGDAAVNAGIVSPIVVMVVATSSVANMVFSDVDIVNACRWWRVLFLIGSSILGLIGFVIILLLLIINLCELESFGIPYTVPFSPFYKKDLSDYLVIKPRNKIKTRPNFLSFKNRTRLGGNNED